MKNNQRGSIAIIVIVIAVLAVVAGGTYYLTTNKEKNPTTQNKDPLDVTLNLDGSQNSNPTSSNNTAELPGMNEVMKRCGGENAKIAGLKSLNALLTAYLNDHDSYPTNLETTLGATGYSGRGYIYAYYPATNPKHYHLGVKVELFPDCGDIIQTFNLDRDSDFNSKTGNYVNGFDGTDPIYDLVNTK